MALLPRSARVFTSSSSLVPLRRSAATPSLTCSRCLAPSRMAPLHRAPLSTNAVRPRLQTLHHARSGGPARVLLLQQQSRRHASTAAAVRNLFRRHPFSMSMAVFFIVSGVGGLIWANYIYQTYILGTFHRFPDPVAAKLRRALYYTNIDPDAQLAVKYYRQALEKAEEVGMDQFSDEVIGVKIQLAALMELNANVPKAVEVLEIIRNDLERYVAENLQEAKAGEAEGEGRQRRRERRRLLRKVVQIDVKLGALYGEVQMRDPEKAEERLVAAVELALREEANWQRERREENVRGEREYVVIGSDGKEQSAAAEAAEDEGDEWMSREEMGAALESLAHNYEEKNQHYLASPLFLQALNLMPQTNCHSVVLMNNLSISLAQQTPTAFATTRQARDSSVIVDRENRPMTSSASMTLTAPPARETLVENAKAWANRALSVAAQIKPPQRDEECDLGCAVATHNLGEFAEMLGDLDAARQRFMEAKSLAKAMGFDEGLQRADEALVRLKGR